MKNSKYSVLIVGCGCIAGGSAIATEKTHVGAIVGQAGLRLSGVVDTSIERAKCFASLYKTNYYGKLEEALEVERPAVVSIATPDETHYEIACKAILSPHKPRVIFLEKPACLHAGEFKMMQDLAKQSDTLVLVNHSRRFCEIHDKIRNAIHAGLFGTVTRVNATYYGGWIHNGTHIVDTIVYLTGAGIEWSSIRGIVNSRFPDDACIELSGYLAESEVQVEIKAIDENLYQIFEFDLWLSRGRIRIEDFGESIKSYICVKNADGESVLHEQDAGFAKAVERTSMENAYKEIADYLAGQITPKSGFVHEASLANLGLTMSALFDARVLAQKQCLP